MRKITSLRVAVSTAIAFGVVLASGTTALAGGTGNGGGGGGGGGGGNGCGACGGGGGIAVNGQCANAAQSNYTWPGAWGGRAVAFARIAANLYDPISNPGGTAYQTNPGILPVGMGLPIPGYTWGCINTMSAGPPAFPGFGSSSAITRNTPTLNLLSTGPFLVFQPVRMKLTPPPSTCLAPVEAPLTPVDVGGSPTLTPLSVPVGGAGMPLGNWNTNVPGCPGSAEIHGKAPGWEWIYAQQASLDGGGVAWGGLGPAPVCAPDYSWCDGRFQHVLNNQSPGISATATWTQWCWAFVVNTITGSWSYMKPIRGVAGSPLATETDAATGVILTCNGPFDGPITLAAAPAGNITVQQIEGVG